MNEFVTVSESKTVTAHEIFNNNITKYTFTSTMNNALPEKKVNGRVNLSEKKLNRYFPARMTSMERERIILELLEEWKERKNS